MGRTRSWREISRRNSPPFTSHLSNPRRRFPPHEKPTFHYDSAQQLVWNEAFLFRGRSLRMSCNDQSSKSTTKTASSRLTFASVSRRAKSGSLQVVTQTTKTSLKVAGEKS